MAEYAWTLPERMLVGRNGGKRMLREIRDRYVPPVPVVSTGHGISPLVKDWLRGPLPNRAVDLQDPATPGNRITFNPQEVQQIWCQHLAGWRNHSNLLWALLIFHS